MDTRLVLEPDQGGILFSPDGRARLEFQPGSVSETSVITYSKQAFPSQDLGEDWAFVGRSFNLWANRQSSGQPLSRMLMPYTMTITYDDADWQNGGVFDERSLNLLAWDGKQWRAQLPCLGCALDVAANTLTLVLTELREFALVGSREITLQTGPTFIVNTDDDVDDGQCTRLHCSLREAILAANQRSNEGEPDRIHFYIEGEGEHVIRPRSPLPVITDPLIIDGSTQPLGQIVLDGSLAGDANGLSITAGNSVVRGLVIQKFARSGVWLAKQGGNRVEGNFIGVTADGLLARPNATGVTIFQSADNVIGGEALGASNLISGNNGPGVLIEGAGARGNRVIGNFIGVDLSGVAALGNEVGVEIRDAPENQVGAANSGSRNLISGNRGAGVRVIGAEAVGNRIASNFIGVDASIVQPLGNGGAGVEIAELARETAVGGADPAQANLIAASGRAGVWIRDAFANVVQGNYIGVNVYGLALGQAQDGVLIEGSAADNIIGGLDAGSGNHIAHNGRDGVRVARAETNLIAGNEIYANAGRAIALLDGGNREIAPPLLAGASGREVSGKGLPGATILLYGDDGDQARFYLGSTTVSAEGHFVFEGPQLGRNVTASTLDAAGNVSELSPPAVRDVQFDDTFETNDVWSDATLVEPGGRYESYISSPQDMDFFKLPVPEERGARVRFRLTNLPADYDIILFRPTDVPEDTPPNDLPLQNVPIQDLPLQNVPLQNVPLQNVPLQNVPLQNVPLQNVPLQNVPLQNVPLQNVPLQNVLLDAIPLQNVPIVSHSFKLGREDEEVTDVALYARDHYYLLVVGNNGAYSADPYTLEVDVLPPEPIPACQRDLPFEGLPGLPYAPYADEQVETLILFNKQRLESLYGPGETARIVQAVHDLAEHPTVRGRVLPVELDEDVRMAYDAWDNDVCNPAAANNVAGAIKRLMARTLADMPNVKYLVLVGDDEALPFRRVEDIVQTANEREYEFQAQAKEDSALAASLRLGYVLTDDFYADLSPSIFKGRPLYVPTLAVGRLVETPSEIVGVIEEYLAREGALMLNSSAIFGYSFLKDSSDLVLEALTERGVAATPIINDEWTADTLRQIWLDPEKRWDFTTLNAHFSHYQLAPALWSPLDVTSLFTATEIALSVTDLSGTINYSVGCHSGLNICAACSANPASALDFPQAFAQKRAVWIGNTGYGYGDDTAPALNEELMVRFTRRLGRAEAVPIGQALMEVKQNYALNSLGTYGPYNEKALYVLTLFGLPTYRVSTPFPVAETSTSSAIVSQSLSRSASGLLSQTFVLEPTLTRVETENGVYYAADDTVQTLLYSPVQPQVSLDVSLGDAAPGMIAHGALFLEGEYTDIPAFDPVITMPVTETNRYEPQFIYAGWQPERLSILNRFDLGERVGEQLVVTLGQFEHTEVITDTVNDRVFVQGVERLYQRATYEVFYSDSSDFIPPTIANVYGLERNAGTRVDGLRTVDVFVETFDESGLERVVVTYTDGDGRWRPAELQPVVGTNLWSGVLTGIGGEVAFMAQAVDTAGNVSVTRAKGLLFSAASVALTASSLTIDEGEAVYFTADPSTADNIDAIDNILWRFGDGLNEYGALQIMHRYRDSGEFTVSVFVVDQEGDTGGGALTLTVNNSPPVVDAGPAYSIRPGETVNAAPATFFDAGTLDTHTATVDWGDGSPVEKAPLTENVVGGDPGLAAGSEGVITLGEHTYSKPGRYYIEVCVTDDEGARGCDVTPVNVREDMTADEGERVTLSSAFGGPADEAGYAAIFDWGDGSPPTAGLIADGVATGAHVYADNGVYTVTVQVTNPQGGIELTDTLAIEVANVAPTIELGRSTLIQGNGHVGLAPLIFNDKGALDTHTATIFWGDGTEETALIEQTPFGPPGDEQGADGRILASHNYPALGVYAITVCVRDDDAAETCKTFDGYADLVWRFRGYTYRGALGAAASPLPGVTLKLYGRNAGEAWPADPIKEVVSDGSGFFNFFIIKPYVYDYFRLVSEPPAGLNPAGIWSEDGVIIDANTVEWRSPKPETHMNEFYFLGVAP